MSEGPSRTDITRREMLGTVGKAAVASAVIPPFVFQLDGSSLLGGADPLTAVAGPDRVVVQPGRTYLNAWAGYGVPPWQRRRPRRGEPAEPEPTGPEPTVAWSKKSGPGSVVFEDPKALVTTATFSAPGAYVLEMVADNGDDEVASTFTVTVEDGPPPDHLLPIVTGFYRLDDPFWGRQVKALMVNWIPHCIEMINRNDLELGPGGIDNFIEAGKALRGEPHGRAQGLRLLERLGARDRGVDEPRADGRPAGRPGDHRGAGEDARDARGLDPDHPRRAGAGRLSCRRRSRCATPRTRRRAPQASGGSSAGTHGTAATTRATSRATSSSPPSTTT